MLYLQISTAVILMGSLAFFAFNFRKVVLIIGMGKASQVLDQIPKRLTNLVYQVFFHKKLFRQFFPGLIHFCIVTGFVILSLGTLEWMFQGLSGGLKWKFLGFPIYPVFLFSQDFFNSLVFVAVAAAFFRRIFIKPKRMADNSAKSKWDAYFILMLIWILVISNLVTHAIEIHRSGAEESYAAFQPVAYGISRILSGMNLTAVAYWSWWWTHLLTVLVFLNYLPFSKHLHVILAFPNVFLSKVEPRGRLSTPDLEDESILEFGAERVEDLKWKSIMDSYACTECGRCNEFCPTSTTGKELKPKTLMINLRAAATGRASLYTQMRASESAEALSEEFQQLKSQCLVPQTYTDQFVWDCTTCGACVEACPVMIDHVDVMVEMRRALVLNRGSNPDEATNAFRNWETSSNPWGLPESSRQEWLVERGVPLFEAGADFEYLYYIGCAGSFDERNKKVVDSVVSILQSAGVKFGILGKEEKCNGETARRMGNEWLAQQMMKTNIELLQGKGAKKIITSCPHCFNTLANEYPSLGGNFEVIHHTEVISDLLKSGKLNVQKQKSKVTYHDSCYLGRYNQVYDAPRNALQAVNENPLVELERKREQGFCCGAGGGRMWLEEKTGTRINENRAQEVIESGAKTVGVGCPFCMTMISDGLRSKEREDIAVLDIAEIVAESLVDAKEISSG